MGTSASPGDLTSNTQVSRSGYHSYDLGQTVEGLGDWHGTLEQKRDETEGDGFRADEELVRELLTATGDLNPIHLLEGFAERMGVPESEAEEVFGEFLDDVVEELKPEDSDWSERRSERPEEGYGGVLPGMVYFSAYALETDEPIRELEMGWRNAAWVDDQVRIDDELKGSALTPEGDEWRNSKAKVENVERHSMHDPEYNTEKAAIANKIVARRDRAGDMLASLDVEFYDYIDLDSLEFEILELEEPREENRQKITETGTGDLMQYDTEIVVDGEIIGEATEHYIDADGYAEIEQKYRDKLESPTVFNPWAEFFRNCAEVLRASRQTYAD